MQQPSLQVLARNVEQFTEPDKTLLVEPPAGALEHVLNRAHVVTCNYRTYCYFKDSDLASLHFGLENAHGLRFERVIVFMPKSKPELELLLDYVESVLAHNGCVYIVGEKKAGIASGAKRLAGRSKEIEKIDSAKHCQLWRANGFELREYWSVSDYMREFDIQVGETQLRVCALPGVFASGRLDDGTELLLKQDLRRLKGRTLDFGCGCGVIGAVLKLRKPDIELEGVDINWFALQAASRTLQLNNLTGSIYPSDGWSSIEGRVNGVVTNPPFHQGVSTEYDTTENFIRDAYSKMARYAPMYIVANNFLRYPTLIESVFEKCSYYAKDTRFNVYYCER